MSEMEKSSQPMADDVEFVLSDCEWHSKSSHANKKQDMTKMLIDRSVVEQAFEALAGTYTDKTKHRAQYKLEKAALIGLLNALTTVDKLAPVEAPTAKREPLTDAEIESHDCVLVLWHGYDAFEIVGIKEFARAIEAAHGITKE